MSELEKPYKAIVIDDDPMFAMQVEMALSGIGVVCKSFGSGEEMFDALYRTTADIFIIDYNLDSQNERAMNGGEIVQALRLSNHKQPVIIMSSQTEPQVAVSLMKIGVTDYIEKMDSSLDNLKNSLLNIKRVEEIEDDRLSLEQDYSQNKKRLMVVVGVAALVGVAFTFMKLNLLYTIEHLLHF